MKRSQTRGASAARVRVLRALAFSSALGNLRRQGLGHRPGPCHYRTMMDIRHSKPFQLGSGRFNSVPDHYLLRPPRPSSHRKREKAGDGEDPPTLDGPCRGVQEDQHLASQQIVGMTRWLYTSPSEKERMEFNIFQPRIRQSPQGQ